MCSQLRPLYRYKLICRIFNLKKYQVDEKEKKNWKKKQAADNLKEISVDVLASS